MNRRVTRAGVTLTVALAGFSYEIVLGGGRPAVLSACVTLALVTPATALDAYRRGKALAGFSYEIVLGGGRPAVLSACVTLALVTPATALDAYRRGKALATPSSVPEAPE